MRGAGTVTRRSTPRTRARLLGVLALLTGLLLAGCTGPGSDPNQPDPADPKTLRVLAGSELADLKPILEKARQETGVSVVLEETGTLEASAKVAGGQADGDYDALWISSNRYLAMTTDGQDKVATSTKTMTSPVLLGVRPQAAARLGWSAQTPPTWAQIREAAAGGGFSYAMTNPSASNSGFSTLVAVASALDGQGTALDAARTQAVMPQLAEFFRGQKLTSGSTGWLTEKFVADPAVDGLFSYESTLLSLNASGQLPEKLVVLAPSDGVVSGDYPLSLLKSAPSDKRAAYDALVDYLRSPQVQTEIMTTTWRRPMVGGVQLAPEFGPATTVELPFPATRQVADDLIAGYLDKARRPPSTIYVLDVSGSMEGDRLGELQSAMSALATPGGTDDFTTFRARETITLLPFSSRIGPEQTYVLPADKPDAELGKVRGRIEGLRAGGQTNLYEAMFRAYELADQQVTANPENYVTVVVLTDGQATGQGPDHFMSGYRERSPAAQKVPTFAIVFGDGSRAELEQIAKTTGGEVFDGRADLTDAFRTIRGYQ